MQNHDLQILQVKFAASQFQHTEFESVSLDIVPTKDKLVSVKEPVCFYGYTHIPETCQLPASEFIVELQVMQSGYIG